MNHRLLWAAALLGIMLTACHHAPAEAQIRQGIDAAKTAAEQADASLLGEQLSDDFTGDGELADRSHLLDLLRLAKLRGETIHALTGPVRVVARGDRYVARFTVTLTSGGRLLPEQIGIYEIETAWRREGRHWLCYSAHWKRQL